LTDFIFEIPPYEAFVASLPDGGSVSAAKLLTLLEAESEDTLQQVLDGLETRHITLLTDELPVYAAAGDTALRLQQELALAQSGDLMQGLGENDPLRLYLEELASLPAAGDPALLALEYTRGDESVVPMLTNLMLSRVVENACSFAGHGVLLLDLIQEGSLGLWQGILQYTQGDIEAHCDWWIRQYQAKAVTLQAGASGVGQKLRRSLEDYRDVDQQLLTELGRNPTREEIAQRLHISEEETELLEKMLQNLRKLQLATPQAKDEEETPSEDEERHVEDTAYFQIRQRIQELLSVLEPLDVKILTYRYGLEGGLPLDPQNTGAELGLTAQEVIQRETAALSKLRKEG